MSEINKNTTCFQCHQDLNKSCNKTSCRYWDGDLEKNCVIIQTNNKTHTLQQIGEILGITRMRVCQIEKNIMNKIKKLVD